MNPEFPRIFLTHYIILDKNSNNNKQMRLVKLVLIGKKVRENSDLYFRIQWAR